MIFIYFLKEGGSGSYKTSPGLLRVSLARLVPVDHRCRKSLLHQKRLVLDLLLRFRLTEPAISKGKVEAVETRVTLVRSILLITRWVRIKDNDDDDDNGGGGENEDERRKKKKMPVGRLFTLSPFVLFVHRTTLFCSRKHAFIKGHPLPPPLPSTNRWWTYPSPGLLSPPIPWLT